MTKKQESATRALIEQHKERGTEIILPAFQKIADKPLAKSLSDVMDCVPDVLKEEEQERVKRLEARLVDLGNAETETRMLRAVMAEVITNIRTEEDFTILIVPGTEQSYSNWTEFREVLADILGVSASTLANYVKAVRVARQVCGVQPGKFHVQSGISEMNHMLSVMAGMDGRSPVSYAEQARPKTKEFAEYLQRNYPEAEDNLELLQSYYHNEVAVDREDPSAITKSAGELSAQATQVTGAPNVWAKHLLDDTGDKVVGYRVVVEHPEDEDSAGLIEDFDLLWEGREFIPAPAREWVANRFRIKD